MESNTGGSADRQGGRPPVLLAAVWPVARAVLLAYLAVVVLLMFLENSLIFVPSRYPQGDWTPRGLAIEDVWFQAADGTRLHGWYAAHPRPTAAILFCHGNGGNITHRAELLRTLHDVVGAAVFIFDYRGYGRSEGKPNEAGVTADAQAAHTWLARRSGVSESGLVLMGESLGGAVAVTLAAEKGAAALVLDSTFASLPEVAAARFPWLPVRWLMRSRFDSLGHIADYHGPLWQCHGDCDSIVPRESGRRLFEAANSPKEWFDLEGYDHNDPRPLEYYRAIRRFLDAIEKARKLP